MSDDQIIYCHGWSSGPAVWQRIADEARVAPSFKEVASADAFLPALTRSLPESPYVLVGWSMGGMLAMEAALSQDKNL